MADLNVQKYKRRAYSKRKELAAFMRKIGKSKQKGLLKTVAQVDEAVWREIKCGDCANCCKTMTPTYSRKDINRISKKFGMTYQQFYDKWLKLDENKDIVNKSTPCQFLDKQNRCSIYDIRPADCAEFPHFRRRDFAYQAQEKTYTENMVFCPATLVFVEKLKQTIEADL